MMGQIEASRRRYRRQGVRRAIARLLVRLAVAGLALAALIAGGEAAHDGTASSGHWSLIPEPASIALLGLGLIAAGLLLRIQTRRRARRTRERR